MTTAKQLDVLLRRLVALRVPKDRAVGDSLSQCMVTEETGRGTEGESEWAGTKGKNAYKKTFCVHIF